MTNAGSPSCFTQKFQFVVLTKRIAGSGNEVEGSRQTRHKKGTTRYIWSF